LRAVTYSAKNPKPITSQSVNTATTIVGVFISQIAHVCIKPGRIILKTPYLKRQTQCLHHTKLLKYTIKLKEFQGPYVLGFHLKSTKKDF
jgi:hypothetical protein